MDRKSFIKRFIMASATYSMANSAVASFIETTLGDAISNSATATYYNPACLTLIKKPELLLAGALVPTSSSFTGTTIQNRTGFTQTGKADSFVNLKFPQAYLAYPIKDRLTLAVAGLYTFNGINDFSSQSIVRYIGTYSEVATFDITPALGFKVSDKFSVGAGVDLEHGSITLASMVGAPTMRVGDVESFNHGNSWGYGGHVGFMYQPAKGTTIGFAYHSKVRFNFHGNSTFSSIPQLVSNNFETTVTAPPTTVLSVDQFVNKKLGFMGTIAYIQWSTVQNINLRNVQVINRGRPALTAVTLPYYLYNTLRYRIGVHYAPTEKWMLKGVALYDNEPGNPRYQLFPNDNVTAGGSVAYQFAKAFAFEVGYAHSFYRPQDIDIRTLVLANRAFGKYSQSKDWISAMLKFYWV